MNAFSITFLGHVEIRTGKGAIQVGSKAMLLLARLAMPPAQVHDRKRLTDLLWPDRAEVQAQASLRQALWALKRELGEDGPNLILSDRTTLRLNPDAAQIDCLTFERLIQSGQRDDLERAAEIYQGEYLAGMELDQSDPMTPFLFERNRLQSLYLNCLKDLVHLRETAGDGDGAIAAAQKALVLDSLQEDMHAAIIRLHRDHGRPGLARQHYETCRDLLRSELGVAPSPEIESLRQTLGNRPPQRPPQRSPAPPQDTAPPPVLHPEPPAKRMVRRAVLMLGGLAAAAMVAVAYPAVFPRQTAPIPAALSESPPSLVVLPVLSEGADEEASAFAAGLTDSVISDLGTVSGLSVLADETTLGLTGQTASPERQATQLGVDFALGGRVERRPTGFRVTMQLIRAKDGLRVWENTFDRQDRDVYPVQDEIVQGVAEALSVALSAQESRTVNRIPTTNLEAQDHYLRAETQEYGLAESDALRRALVHYRRAIELDPQFADAWAGYARVAVTIWRGDFNEIMSSGVARKEAYVAAGQALQIDPENARAYQVLSLIQAVDGDHTVAVRTAQKAVTFQLGNADAHTNLATVLLLAGDLDAAAAEVARARHLNPAQSPDLRLTSAMLAFAQRRYADAISEFGAIRLSTPRSELVLEHLAAAYAYLGDQAEAHQIVAELKDLVPITNLGLYRVLAANDGSPPQVAHFIEGLRRAGLPEWPMADQRRPEDRLTGQDLRSIIDGHVWTGKLANGVDFTQYFERDGSFAYASTTSLLTGRAEIREDELCQIIEGYMMGRPSCGYVYRRNGASGAGEAFVYVSIDAIKYFSASK